MQMRKQSVNLKIKQQKLHELKDQKKRISGFRVRGLGKFEQNGPAGGSFVYNGTVLYHNFGGRNVGECIYEDPWSSVPKHSDHFINF
jgi:hypothetical protein